MAGKPFLQQPNTKVAVVSAHICHPIAGSYEIAAGMQPATSGEMFFKGEPWKPATMIEAQRNGISMILQEANTISGCTFSARAVNVS